MCWNSECSFLERPNSRYFFCMFSCNFSHVSRMLTVSMIADHAYPAQVAEDYGHGKPAVFEPALIHCAHLLAWNAWSDFKSIVEEKSLQLTDRRSVTAIKGPAPRFSPRAPISSCTILQEFHIKTFIY